MGTSKDLAGVNDERNILIVYLKNDLTFGDLIPRMREYILRRFNGMDNILGIELKEEIFDAVGKVKNLFDEVYKAGMTMYSDIHGRLEVDILAYALKPFYIKTGYIQSNEKAIIVISDEDIIRIENLYDSKIIFDNDFMGEIEQYLKDHIVTDDGRIIRR